MAEDVPDSNKSPKVKKMKLPKLPSKGEKNSVNFKKLKQTPARSQVRIKVVNGRRMFDRTCKNTSTTNKNDNCSSVSS